MLAHRPSQLNVALKHPTLPNVYNNQDILYLVRECLRTLPRGTDIHVHTCLMTMLNETHRQNLTQVLIALMSNMDVYFNMHSLEHQAIVSKFRRSGDHILASYADLATLYFNSTMLAILEFLSVPTPDTAMILNSPLQRLEAILTHLVGANEDVTKCLGHLSRSCIDDQHLRYTLSMCASEMLQCITSRRAITIVMQVNSDFGDQCNLSMKGVERLLQMAIVCCSPDTVRWIRNTFNTLQLSRPVILLGLYMQQTDLVMGPERNCRLSLQESKWMVRNCRVDVLKFCIDRKWLDHQVEHATGVRSSDDDKWPVRVGCRPPPQ